MKTLKLIWKNKDLRNKLLIVIAILFGIRILSGIPTPGVNRNYFKLLLAQNSTLNFFNAISGNGLSNLSIMALSITPYITASIIIQLLGVIFPQVKELQQCKTKADKRKYEWILVFSGAGLACLESLTMAIGFGRKGLLKMQILLLLYIGPMIRLHTEKHLLVFLRKQSKLNRAAFLIIKMHLQKLNQTSFAVGNTRIQERILIFHIRHGV